MVAPESTLVYHQATIREHRDQPDKMIEPEHTGEVLQTADNSVNVLIGTLIHRQGAYIIDKFLANQEEIQSAYPSSKLIIATSETDYSAELNNLLNCRKLRSCVINYQVIKPNHAQSRIWNIASGREALRNYMLGLNQAQYLLFLDSDMTFDPSVISIMEREIQGYDAVFSGYYFRNYGLGFAGAGCLMLTRTILPKIEFRCYEFKNGEVIFEDNIVEMDIFQSGGRIKKGIFVAAEHYTAADEFQRAVPRPMSIGQRITNHPLLRYFLIKASIMVRYNIPWHIKVFFSKWSA